MENKASPDVRVFVGKAVRQARQNKAWSQERLADECSLHRTYIGGIERGERNVSIDNLSKIAGALQVAPSTLLPDYILPNGLK